MRTFYSASIMVICLYLCGCNDGQVAGGGTETTNTISGTLSATNIGDFGKDVYGEISVLAFSSDYRPDSSVGSVDTASVNEEGAFSFSLEDGIYNIFAWHKPSGYGVYMPDISIDSVLPVQELAATGTVAGSVPLVEEGLFLKSAGIYIEGSPFYALADTAGRFILANVPRGIYDLSYKSLYLSILDTLLLQPPITSAYTVSAGFSIDPAAEDTMFVFKPPKP